MDFPQEKSRWIAGGTAWRTPTIERIANAKISHRTILYRAVLSLVLAAAPFGTAAVQAQEERPQITPGERRGPRKKDAAEPRALAILRLSSDGKSALVPIAILINGKFWDAGAYKASPVPMALDPGTVYEAEHTGSSIGLFTVSNALHSKAANAAVPWLATGSWVPSGTDSGKKTLQADVAPKGIDNSDAPPRLTRNPADSPSKPASGSTPSSSTTPSSTAPSPAPTSSSGDDPPRLSKPAQPSATPDSSSPQSEPKPADSAPGGKTDSTRPDAAKPDSAKPGSDKSGDKKADDSKQAENTPTSDSGASEGHRPRLRRGKPAESFADQDIPGYSKVSASISASAPASSGAKGAAVMALGPAQLIPAISDSAGPDPHSYGFEWLKGEESDRRQQLIALAEDQVRAYVEARAKARIEPVAVPKTTTHHAATKKLPTPVLSNVQMTAYDLWSTNVPVVVFSAQAQMPPAPPGKVVPAASSALSAPAPAAGEDLQYSVLLVAYPDIYNNLHKLYSGVTDKFHLDLTPRLELVDAVDADGDGRGELLFSETSDAGNGYVIYRATADKLWKMYDSLNPE